MRCCISSASFSGLKLLSGKTPRVPCSFSFPKIQRRPGRSQTWLSLLLECLAAWHPYRWQKSRLRWGITKSDFVGHLTASLTVSKLISLSHRVLVLSPRSCVWMHARTIRKPFDGWVEVKQTRQCLFRAFFFFKRQCFFVLQSEMKVNLWKQFNYN